MLPAAAGGGKSVSPSPPVRPGGPTCTFPRWSTSRPRRPGRRQACPGARPRTWPRSGSRSPGARSASCTRATATRCSTSCSPRTTRTRTGCRSGPSCGPAASRWPTPSRSARWAGGACSSSAAGSDWSAWPPPWPVRASSRSTGRPRRSPSPPPTPPATASSCAPPCAPSTVRASCSPRPRGTWSSPPTSSTTAATSRCWSRCCPSWSAPAGRCGWRTRSGAWPAPSWPSSTPPAGGASASGRGSTRWPSTACAARPATAAARAERRLPAAWRSCRLPVWLPARRLRQLAESGTLVKGAAAKEVSWMPVISLPGGPRRRWIWGLGAGVLVAAVVAALVVAGGSGSSPLAPPGSSPPENRAAPEKFPLTRLPVTYQSKDAALVGPVRSVRPVDAPLLRELGGGLFGFSGGSAGVLAEVRRTSDATFLEPGRAAGAYHRVAGRPAPHNLFTSTAGLYQAGRTADGGLGPPPELFTYDEAAPAGARLLSRARLRFSPSSRAAWQWDAGAGSFVRYQDGTLQREEGGARITTENVVILHVAIGSTSNVDAAGNVTPDVKVVGEGAAWVLRDGKLVTGRWRRPAASEPVQLLGSDGAAIALHPGRTWMELLPERAPPAFG